jgi:O-antigen/teichoic acid export membrane protein
VVQILARIGALLCGLVLMGYLTRSLGLGDYGRYALAIVLVNWAGTSIALASGGALIRLVAGHAEGEKFAVAMLQLVGLAGLGAGAVVFAGAEWIARAMNSPGLAPLLRILAWDLPIGALAGLHIGILTAQGSFQLGAAKIPIRHQSFCELTFRHYGTHHHQPQSMWRATLHSRDANSRQRCLGHAGGWRHARGNPCGLPGFGS